MDDLPVSYAANLASLTTQVKSLEGDYSKMELAVTNLDRKIDHSFSTLSSRFESALATLTSKLDDRDRPQWQMYGVFATVAIAMAGFFFWPINNQGQENKQQLLENTKLLHQFLQEMPEHYVNYREHDRLLREVDEIKKREVDRLSVKSSPPP